MGLLSRFKKKPETSNAHENGEFRSRSAEDSLESRARGKKTEAPRRGQLSDPMLPEKKRARRRLIGAVALALAVIIGLPMLLDSEPKPLSDDISIRIPSKDKPLSAASAAAQLPVPARQIAAPELDASEEIIEPVSPATNKVAALVAAPQPTPHVVAAEIPAKLERLPELKSEPKPEVKPPKPSKPVEAEVALKPEHKSESKAEPKLESKPEPAKALKSDDDAARALAILEGKSSPKAAPKSAYLVQVAALAAQDKVDDLQAKLKAAGIHSYTQKVATSSGEKIRVRVGPFESHEEADRMQAKLSKLGVGGTLIPAN
ncbi:MULTISPECIES: SPOR domain-containing protein [unclassified Undibacterium]|uniref:SPOR domain-containing protein n=1 Tax=unclassified Undibacterium TaxID=2630295 RepID=UPI002AC926F1|nr:MULTISPECIES: SPOR domain-containing protein [unclassified Undibacterium]MEB0138458.1 SPOR domain-containing protein [Undibacterium sp. CCC2.1]MEB0173141.1 SPOR domain-containing protein [Undibacterium sp. CCC1.1]MEB0177532.1 SPOR domain-containing protein [Undibacterium sp. CCC3.4]MEB0216152.1 SPOR domain-containing protein [Undibacterium sp. 5I2]WPX42799.1 SPOR domain-containing protein [Undibacterium sp. CCC3.4]